MVDAAKQPNVISTPAATPTIRVALLVEYCGADFHGSQLQPERPTIQKAIQDALIALNLKTSAVSFAGRTDAGVHALGHVAHFDMAEGVLNNIPDLPEALNAVLPDSIAIRGAHIATGSDFNSRRDTSAKWYRYRIHNALHRSAWMQQATHCRPLLDVARMQEAARLLCGQHDFKSFKDSATDVTDDICDVRYINVMREGHLVTLDIVADRFLYKMVRNIAGTLMAIGNAEKPQPPHIVLDILGARDRRKAAATARPEGLTLMAIQYPAPYDFFAQDLTVRQLEQMLKQTEMESYDENLFRKAS